MIERILFNLELAFIDLFTSYGLMTILILILSIFIKKDIVKKIDEYSNRLISFIGILYSIVWIIIILIELNNIDPESRIELINRMFGKYWFGFWLQPLLWFSLSQLLRFKSVQKNVLLRLIFSFLFIFSIEKMIMIIVSFHRDYLPSSWTMYSSIYPSNIFLELLLRISIFLILIGVYTIIDKKFNNWKTSKIKSR